MLCFYACLKRSKPNVNTLNTRLAHTKPSSIKTLICQNRYPQALKSSLFRSQFSPQLTDQIYALFIKSGHSLEPYLSSILISHFSKFNDLSRPLNFLLDTINPDIITYNALISGFARFKEHGSIFKLFNELRHMGLVPDAFTLSSLVKGCEGVRESRIAHGVCLRLGFGYQAFMVSGLVENYSRNGDLGSAERCFEECLDVDNVVCTAMICGYVWNGEFDKGKAMFVKLGGLGLELNEFSLTGVMGALFDVREGEQIHCFGIKKGFLYDCSMHLSNAVMSMYTRCVSKEKAIMVFDEISFPDVVSWSERIDASYDGEEALEVFKVLHYIGLDMNEYTLINVLSAIGGVKFLKAGQQIYALCQKAGYLQVVSVGNTFVSLYGKFGKIRDAWHVFDHMMTQDSVSWNSLITACSENGYVSEALEVFSCMRDLLLQPTIYTLVSILDIVSNLNCMGLATQIHSHVIKSGFMSDDSMVTSLIITYGRCNGMNESKRLFSEIDDVNLVNLNAMLITLVQASCHTDALELFQTTWSSHLEVDSKTFSIIFKACGAITDLEQGRAIHSLVVKTGFGCDNFVESAVIDIYCKCGSIGEAEEVFRNTSILNLAAWNAMIMGYAQHNHCEEVFQLLNRMSEFGLEPDEITYLGILTSCCHAGLVTDALYHLSSMFEIHGIVPHLEHYACVIDLLGRVGLLEHAKEIIDHMPIHPDVHIWQILLSACSIHGNVELGEVAANKLLELQPENDSAHILLSNLYASAGMWNDVRKLRKEMKEKIINKEPASSWIQVEGSIHNFFAGDTSHPLSRDIYDELIRLYKQTLTPPEVEQYGIFL